MTSMARDEDILFWDMDWHSVVEHQKRQAQLKAESLTAEDFDKATLDDLADGLAAELALVPPKIFPENLDVRQREVEIDVSGHRDRYSMRPGPHYVKGTAIDVRLPYEGDKAMFQVRPSTYNHSPPHGRVTAEHVEFTIESVSLEKDQVKSEIEERIKAITEFLDFQSQSIGNFPDELRKVAYQALEQRQKKLQADSDVITGLGYQIREE